MHCKKLLFACLCFGWLPVAAELGPIPDPLSLQQALEYAQESDPDVETAQAQVDKARALQAAEDSRTSTRVGLIAALRVVEPSSLGGEVYPSNNDSAANLVVNKRLYDFGASENLVAAAERELQGSQLDFTSVRQQRYLRIMRDYFNVLLADQEYIRDNESMSMAYVQFDRARDRGELGQVSDVELLALENDYQRLLHSRQRSESRQRSSRSRLAITLNRPSQLPSTLLQPDLHHQQRELPPLETLLDEARDNNLDIRAQRMQLQAAQKRIRAALARHNPVLSGELQAGWYNRPFGGDDPLSAALVIEVPLITGGEIDAEVAAQRAELRSVNARLLSTEQELRQSILEVWLEISDLRQQVAELDNRLQFRDLYLERSRAQYELELKTDLGDAMSKMSGVTLARMRNQFALELAWVKLDLLVGRSPDSVALRFPDDQRSE